MVKKSLLYIVALLALSCVLFVACNPVSSSNKATSLSVDTQSYRFAATASTSADNSSSKTITATVSPSSATSRIQFALSWKDPNSTWASGKNISDYLTLTISSSNKGQAVLSCKQAFGEQAIITITCDECSRSISVDYEYKLTHIEVTLLGSNDTWFKATWDEGDDKMSYTYGGVPASGHGSWPLFPDVDYEGEVSDSYTIGTVGSKEVVLIFQCSGTTDEVYISDWRQMRASELEISSQEQGVFGVKVGSQKYYTPVMDLGW